MLRPYFLGKQELHPFACTEDIDVNKEQYKALRPGDLLFFTNKIGRRISENFNNEYCIFEGMCGRNEPYLYWPLWGEGGWRGSVSKSQMLRDFELGSPRQCILEEK